MTEEKIHLIQELVEYFRHEGHDIISAKQSIGFRSPAPLPNDGYGDQQPKQPDVLAFDKTKKCFLIGITRVAKSELDSEESLTEYNVFLDQKDQVTGEPHRLLIMVPPSCINDMTSLLTHYIHREYWHRVTIVSSAREPA